MMDTPGSATFWSLPKRLALMLGFCLTLVGAARAQVTAPPVTPMPVPSVTPRKDDASIARARELLALARKAVGVDALQRLQSLSAKLKLRREFKYVSVQSPTKVVEKQESLSGKIEMDFLLPDKFRRRVKSRDWRGFSYSYAETVNGREAWRNPALPARPLGREQRVIDVNDFERNLERQSQNARHQLAFYSLGWLLRELPSMPLQITYHGTYDIDLGKVDALNVDGPEDFSALLLLDANSHLPVALVAVAVISPRVPVYVETGSFDRRFVRETYARARRETQARSKPPQRMELRWVLSEHKLVDGLRLPQRVTILLNGELVEELTMTELELNQQVNPKKFEERPKELTQ